MPERIPKKIGKGEGGENLPKLNNLLGLLADATKTIYDEIDDLNPAKRPLIKHNEKFLEVVETSPEAGEEEVSVGDDIDITFNEEIEFWKNSSETEGQVKVIKLDDDSEHTIDSVSIEEDDGDDLILRISPDGDLDADEEYQVVVEKEAVISKGDKLGMEKDYKFTFRTAE